MQLIKAVMNGTQNLLNSLADESGTPVIFFVASRAQPHNKKKHIDTSSAYGLSRPFF